MTRPTGNPVRRPRTKDYKTILARIPKDLHDQVTSYAYRHRQSVSELIRDGLLWRISDGDPLGYGVAGTPTAEDDNPVLRHAEAWIPDMSLESDAPVAESSGKR